MRAALAIGLPWAICLATGSAISALWISFGVLRALISETGGDYRTRFRSVIVGPLFGAAGFLASGLGTLPWSVTVATMTVVGFLAGMASSYSALLSIGATQGLLIASIAIGLPEAASGWTPPLLYLSGVALYTAMLGIEALCAREGGRNGAVTAMVGALGELAARRAIAPSGNQIERADVEAARRAVTACFTMLGSIAMRTASQHFGKGDEGARLASVLARGDAVFVALMASQDEAGLQAAATALRAAAVGGTIPPVSSHDPIGVALGGLLGMLGIAGAVPSNASGLPMVPAGAPVSRRIHVAMDQFVPTGAVVRSAAAVALCLGIAYAARWLISAEHWYWIPLTVGLVMKPDLGSVFARAVLRVVGTVIGAAIGAVIVLLVPAGVWLAAPIALFAGLTPAAAQRSYALLAATVTPVILILVSMMDPGPIDVAYCIQRIVDTSIGGGIALVFGYFIWPRTHFNKLSSDFYRAKQRVADYILATLSRDDGTGDSRLPVVRRAAYGNLMDMRMHLRAALAEPPPASEEAAAWFPLIAAAARICDHVTTYATGAETPVPPVDADALARLAAHVSATPDERQHRPAPSCTGCSARVVELFGQVERELQHMDRLRDDHAFVAVSRPPRRRRVDEG